MENLSEKIKYVVVFLVVILFSFILWPAIRGDHKIDQIKITFIEGSTNEDIVRLLSEKISNFNKDVFLNDPRSKQGYLFPDTYFFFPFATPDEVLKAMTLNFTKRVLLLDQDIKSSGRSLEDIIIMASILEKEASGKEDIGIISGILWKRIKLGIPLQVDIAPATYKESGLPQKPIGNPGLRAIKAAINPIVTSYLFYLHDKDGKVHYAVNFTEHKKNIAKYLK
ncbi:MAG: endolytic transglycosylase MltG [Candidatus Paceibacterota bacterium]